MKLIADLHIHGCYSMATSKDINIKNLEKYAIIKGIGLLGTGDFTHPKWRDELNKNLKEDGSGILWTDTKFPFILQTEISLVYTQSNKGRRVHLIVLAPSFDICDKIIDYLKQKGRVDYDGRPIFKISCINFTKDMKDISNEIEIIPAHIWTPWFGLLGSKSGFDSVEEAFGEQSKNIFALETGLSSDIEMNAKLSSLDKYTLISNSDLHSFWPWRIGREANILNLKDMSYRSIIECIRNKNMMTIEVDPGYGKYHFDGHRVCNVCSSPQETRKNKGICPLCKRPLTIGVLNRVEELADRSEGYFNKSMQKSIKLIPLSEIICMVKGHKLGSKNNWEEYYKLVNEDRPEYYILLSSPEEELLRLTDKELTEAILKNREGKIEVMPGYDGEYGIPVYGKSDVIRNLRGEESLDEETTEKGIGKKRQSDSKKTNMENTNKKPKNAVKEKQLAMGDF